MGTAANCCQLLAARRRTSQRKVLDVAMRKKWKKGKKEGKKGKKEGKKGEKEGKKGAKVTKVEGHIITIFELL